jgi:hypothetical protein
MTVSAQAFVVTKNGGKYLQQLCKHWSHRLNVAFDAAHGEVVFPNGAKAVMGAHTDQLRVRVTAPDPGTLARMQEVIREHLDRFAFREAPLAFEWRAG